MTEECTICLTAGSGIPMYFATATVELSINWTASAFTLLRKKVPVVCVLVKSTQVVANSIPIHSYIVKE